MITSLLSQNTFKNHKSATYKFQCGQTNQKRFSLIVFILSMLHLARGMKVIAPDASDSSAITFDLNCVPPSWSLDPELPSDIDHSPHLPSSRPTFDLNISPSEDPNNPLGVEASTVHTSSLNQPAVGGREEEAQHLASKDVNDKHRVYANEYKKLRVRFPQRTEDSDPVAPSKQFGKLQNSIQHITSAKPFGEEFVAPESFKSPVSNDPGSLDSPTQQESGSLSNTDSYTKSSKLKIFSSTSKKENNVPFEEIWESASPGEFSFASSDALETENSVNPPKKRKLAHWNPSHNRGTGTGEDDGFSTPLESRNSESTFTEKPLRNSRYQEYSPRADSSQGLSRLPPKKRISAELARKYYPSKDASDDSQVLNPTDS